MRWVIWRKCMKAISGDVHIGNIAKKVETIHIRGIADKRKIKFKKGTPSIKDEE